ncbi:MAG: hypothetical protein AAF213_13905 [Pseudomonadota bacterium]
MAEKGQLAEAGLAKIAALADGNGIDGRQVKLVKAKEGDARIHGQVNVEIHGKVSTRRMPGELPDGINLCATRHDWETRAKTASQQAGQDPQLREQLLQLVMDRPGKGWGFQTNKLKLPASSMSFGFIEVCDVCHGQGMVTCPTCAGDGWVTCRACSGRGQVQCTACNGTGQVDTPMGKAPCAQCGGTGEMQCDQCAGKGRVQCPTCHGKQQIGCDNCSRKGHFANIADVNLVGRAQFRLAQKDVPPPMQRVFKLAPPTVLDERQADIEILNEETTNGGLRVNYRVEFPLAQLMLAFGKPKAKKTPKLPVVVFGHQAKLGAVPAFLDKMIQPGVQNLENAAAGKGNVADNIRKATKFRLLKIGIVQALSGREDVDQFLLERFPHGLSKKLATHIDGLLDRAFLHITRRPRLQAMVVCTLIAPLVSFGAYMMPLRYSLLTTTQQPAAGWAFDALIPLLCLAFTLMATRYVSARALKLSLPALFNEAIDAAYKRASEPDNQAALNVVMS